MKSISITELSPTLQISEQSDGFWLWDDTRKMNLAMCAKTRDAAFVQALSYYQERLKETENAHAELSKKVEAFVSQFVEGERD